jgi:hypothetical protein
MIIILLKIISFFIGALLILVSIRGFKLFFNGDLEFLGRGYKNKKCAEIGSYINHNKMLKRSEGFILNRKGKLLSNACASDAEVYLRLKGEEKISRSH